MLGLGFEDWGLGFKVAGLLFRVQELRDEGLGIMVSGFGCGDPKPSTVNPSEFGNSKPLTPFLGFRAEGG